MTANGSFEIGSIKVGRGKRGFTRLPVTSLLVGAELAIPLHVVHGAKEGPVLGLLSGIHGDEDFVVRIVREVVLGLNPETLAGTVLAIPVANPVAFARSKRSTPEEDIDFGDMNRIFPGVRAKPAFGGGESQPSDRALTEWMAAKISEEFFPRLRYLIDFHCNVVGCSLVESIAKACDSDERSRESFEMNRLLGLGVIHDAGEMLPVTATGYASQIGVTTAVCEIGGGGLSEPIQKKALKIGVDGVINVMRYLRMVAGEPTSPGRQLYGSWQPHVRPTKAGYLLSEFDPDCLFESSPLGLPVQEGELLGVVFDPYSFKEVEKLYAPTDGILYSCRASGPVNAGSHAYAVTAYEGAQWVE